MPGTTQQAAVGLEPAAAYYRRRVATALRSGRYRAELVPCACGAGEGEDLTWTDRYGLPAPMRLCGRCALIYQSPRLDEASRLAFYRDEYQGLYADGGLPEFQCSFKPNFDLPAFLAHFDLQPKVVAELGAGDGRFLAPFAAAGIEAVGADVVPNDPSGRVVRGGIEALRPWAGRVDVLLLHHVFEHLGDLPATLSGIAELLAPGGHVYIALPGLYSFPRERLWQGAHLYQFTESTLTWLMGRHGFEPVYGDELICSLWQRAEEPAPEPSRRAVAEESARIRARLAGRPAPLPLFKTTSKFPVAQRREQIRSALERRLPDMSRLIASERGAAVIVAAGPSLDDGAWAEVAAKVKAGSHLIAIDRAYPTALNHGLVPRYVVAMDAEPDVVEGFRAPHPATCHLLASQCHPAAFDALDGYSVHLFQTPQKGVDMARLANDGGYEKLTVLNGGGTVTLAAFAAGMALGYRSFDFFGFDCHTSQGVYAPGMAGEGATAGAIEVRVDERVFRTRADYFSFAQQFFLLYEMAREDGLCQRCTIHGDSLVAAMSHSGPTLGH